jgi:hypothetical protein
MADFAISISDSLRLFGGGPSTKWGVGTYFTMTWNMSKWGEGTEEIQHHIEPVITDSQGLNSAMQPYDMIHVLSESITPTSETTSEGLLLGSWSYSFTYPTTQGETRSSGSFTVVTTPSGTWTTPSSNGDDWSEA